MHFVYTKIRLMANQLIWTFPLDLLLTVMMGVGGGVCVCVCVWLGGWIDVCGGVCICAHH